jgi:protein-S-isoprenylcysteine O-methyltransferase Ste14
MRPADVFYSVAKGPKWRRVLLTPVGLLLFGGLLWLLIWGSLSTDRALGLPRLLPGAPGLVVGIVLLSAGMVACAWCVILFRRGRGTPVPFNPPQELVVAGPYAWVRNPMLTGVFASLFGLGFLFHSLSLVLVWTPAFVLMNAIELKLVEEPELERRFGASYHEYRRHVPMFVPRAPGVRTKDASPNRR